MNFVINVLRRDAFSGQGKPLAGGDDEAKIWLVRHAEWRGYFAEPSAKEHIASLTGLPVRNIPSLDECPVLCTGDQALLMVRDQHVPDTRKVPGQPVKRVSSWEFTELIGE